MFTTMILLAIAMGGSFGLGKKSAEEHLHPSKITEPKLVCEDSSTSVRGEGVKVKKCWKVTVEEQKLEVIETAAH